MNEEQSLVLADGSTIKVGQKCQAYARSRSLPARWRNAILTRILDEKRVRVMDKHGSRIVRVHNLRVAS